MTKISEYVFFFYVFNSKQNPPYIEFYRKSVLKSVSDPFFTERPFFCRGPFLNDIRRFHVQKGPPLYITNPFRDFLPCRWTLFVPYNRLF